MELSAIRATGYARPHIADAIVVGAGVVGMATAYRLAAEGVSVLLIDKAPEPARGASFANGAQLSYAYTDPLAHPSLIARLPALALGADPAFRMRPSADPHYLRWLLKFLRNCTHDRFRANMLAGLRLAIESKLEMHDLLARHPLEFGYAAPGKLHLYEDEAALARAGEIVSLKVRAGAVQHVLTPAEACAVEPALEGIRKRVVGAVHSPEEEVGDPFLFCRSLLARLRSDYGLRTSFGLSVSRLDIEGPRPAALMENGERFEADAMVLCTGVDSPRVLHGTGIKVPILPMKGYSVTAPLGEDAPRVSITDVARKLVFCRLSGRMRIAGLADLGAHRTDVQPARLAALLEAAKQSLPQAARYDRLESSWAGLRPMTPDSLPIIRRAGDRVVLNVGHGALGWTYAMGAAKRAAGLLLEQHGRPGARFSEAHIGNAGGAAR